MSAMLQTLRWLWCLSLTASCLMAGLSAPLHAQTTLPNPPENSELTEGLLELINEPELKETPRPPTRSVPPNLTPADVGLDGEDLGEDPANPLESVHHRMLISAGLMKRGSIDKSTQQLQASIVHRLDELIASLEKALPPQNSSASAPTTSTQSSGAKNESAASAQQGAQRSEQRTQELSQSPSTRLAEDATAASQPGQQGNAANAAIDLADPKALQQNVWGHLPERLRTQMQSRMVEQFLPSHREQLEAYFKALLEQQ